jgi:hypothetical protein
MKLFDHTSQLLHRKNIPRHLQFCEAGEGIRALDKMPAE